MADEDQFCLYEGVNGQAVVLAVRLSPQNIEWLAKTTKWDLEVVGEGVQILTLVHPSWGPAVVVYGDYIISDMAGNYMPCDGEMFETHYRRK